MLGNADTDRFALPLLEWNENCYVCTFYLQEVKKDDRTEHFKIDGVDVIVGIGKGSRLVAHTLHHQPQHTPDEYKLRQALWLWIDKYVPFERKVLHLLQFGDIKKAQDKIPPSESRLYPPVVAVTSMGLSGAERLYNPTYVTPTTTPHPILMANVFELAHHFEWPLWVADQYVAVAQTYAGYFWGKKVTSAQMTPITDDEEGYARDTSVKMLDEDWVEPFDIEDDCPFCQRMTDESVEQRVAAFQWEIDKEVSARMRVRQGPSHSAFDETPDGRVAYHAEVDQHLTENPDLFRPLPLIRLPFRLKRLLCIQWNHVVRDWMHNDPRYAYKDGHYYALWTERLGGPYTLSTKSDYYGNISTLGYYQQVGNALRAFGYDVPVPEEEGEPPLEDSIWFG